MPLTTAETSARVSPEVRAVSWAEIDRGQEEAKAQEQPVAARLLPKRDGQETQEP